MFMCQDIVIAKSSSCPADTDSVPEGFKGLYQSHYSGWWLLNVYIRVAALAGGI